MVAAGRIAGACPRLRQLLRHAAPADRRRRSPPGATSSAISTGRGPSSSPARCGEDLVAVFVLPPSLAALEAAAARRAPRTADRRGRRADGQISRGNQPLGRIRLRDRQRHDRRERRARRGRSSPPNGCAASGRPASPNSSPRCAPADKAAPAGDTPSPSPTAPKTAPRHIVRITRSSFADYAGMLGASHDTSGMVRLRLRVNAAGARPDFSRLARDPAEGEGDRRGVSRQFVERGRHRLSGRG